MRPITHDDLLGVRSASDVALSPEGTQIAFTLSDNWISGTKNPRSAIWVVPASGGAPTPITGGPQCDRLPRWSPDGKRLAFLSDRTEPAAGTLRLHIYALATGRIEAVACPAGSVKDFQWSTSGKELAVLLEPKSDEPNGTDPTCFEARPHYWRVWVLSLRGAETRPVTPEGVQVWEFDWSRDQRSFALLTSQTPFEWSWYQAKLSIIAADGGPLRTVYEPGHRQLARPLFSPDGNRVAFLSSSWSDRGFVAGDLLTVPVAGGQARNLTPEYMGSVSWMEWSEKDSLLALASEEFDTVLIAVGMDGSRQERARGHFAGVPRAQPAFSRVGNLLAIGREDAARPTDLWTLRIDATGAQWRQLTDLNPQTAHVAVGQSQIFRWRTFDGQELEGLLTLPVGYQPGQRYPVVVNPHGGPTGRTALRFIPSWQQFLPIHGCAVFQPNFRGSTGRGVAFAEANLGDMGGGDFQDIMTGVDALIAAGIADPNRLGFGGWSYGGFLSAWAATQTDRFKCIMMGAGIANWLSFHGRSYLQTWDELYLKANPYTGDAYTRWSPIFYVDRVKTPVLILHGEKDGDVPVGQSYEFHRALVERGVRTELVVYPREPHGFREPAHQRDLWTRVLGWYTYYLELTD